MGTRTLLAAITLGIFAAGAQSQVAVTPSRQNLPVDSAKGNPGVLWRDPGDVARLDFVGGPGGADFAPVPPFTFQEEQGGGTSAKLVLRDAAKRTWELKWGPEVNAETFATRLLWAVGYNVEPAYFVPSGKIENVGALTRAAPLIDRANGNAFHNARFELRDDHIQLTTSPGWFLNQNPFLNTNELQGLKIMSMLVSNWDLKDPRSPDGSNTAIVRFKHDDGAEELLYLVNDWGASMGKWGGVMTRSKWDCKGYTSQNADFVRLSADGKLHFGYSGKLTKDVAEGVTIENLRWLMQYLGRITDDQLRAGLQASGATPQEVGCFVPAIRARIDALDRIAGRVMSSR